MNAALGGYALFVALVKQALFWLAVVVAVIALLDWAVRTRRINPFGAVARFCREFVDPLMRPVERRVVRAGGQPSSAPWWSLVFVIVGGLLLVAVLQFAGGLLASLLYGARSPAGIAALLIGWTFGLLRIALLVRVVSSWVRISPYSRWIHWSYQLTEWMLGPLRRVVPTFGPVDITPIVAYFLLALAQSLIGG